MGLVSPGAGHYGKPHSPFIAIHHESVLTLFGYSLIALALIHILGRNMSRSKRLALSLVTLILLNAPTLLMMLLNT